MNTLPFIKTHIPVTKPVFSDIYSFIKAIDINNFVEVGCHNGSDTRIFREMHPNARIVCFEPDPRNIKILDDFKIKDIAEVYPYALSNVNGDSEFYMSSGDCSRLDVPDILKNYDWSLSSSLKRPTGHLQVHRWVTFPRSVTVKCIRLDDFEPLKNATIDLIWADVQGAEDLVFSGATETLKRTKYIYTEYCNSELYESQLNRQQIFSLLGSDWELVHDFGGDILLKNKTFPF
jgi:FkbM family methyltransferase